MKYNPRINEALAALIHHIHPSQTEDTMQGLLQIYYEFERFLKEISGGMDRFTLRTRRGGLARRVHRCLDNSSLPRIQRGGIRAA